MKIEEIGELARLDVKPGDKFVLHCDVVLSREMHDRIQQVWKHTFEGGSVPPLLVFDHGMKLGVVRQEDAA